MSLLGFFKICFKLLITHSFTPFTRPSTSSLRQRWHDGTVREREPSSPRGRRLSRRSSSEIWDCLVPRCGPALEWPWGPAMRLSVGREVQWPAPEWLHSSKTPRVCHSQASEPPPPPRPSPPPPPDFTERGLQGSGTNEAAGISLARY